MAIVGMGRERRNPSTADIPHSARAIRGIDAERAAENRISFDEMRSHAGVRKGKNRRSVWAWMATAEEADGSLCRGRGAGLADVPSGDERLRQEVGDARRFVGVGAAQGGPDMNTSAFYEYPKSCNRPPIPLII